MSIANAENVFKFRIVPWWTDDCSTFLTNLFKWFPRTVSRPLRVLEFGGGNSTFYLLSKGLKVVSIENDDRYIEFISNVASKVGHSVLISSPQDFDLGLLEEFSLVVIKANSLSETEDLLTKFEWDFVVNDGISRREVIEDIHVNNINTIVILDNTEYCANWGRLDRSSGNPDLVRAYRAILRDKNWRHYIFEQMEGRNGGGSADKTGWEAPHRWLSSVLWPSDHLLGRLMVSNVGFPLVNSDGGYNQDIETLRDRCPFDADSNQWIKGPFPAELDLKLDRGFN